MRINLSIIVVFFFTTCLCKAQRFNAGFTGGAAVSDVAGSNTRDKGNHFNKLGFVAGGIVCSNLNDKITLQLEINYTTKGTLQKPDSANNGYFKLGLHYVEVPLIFRKRFHFTIFKKPTDRFCIEAGASLGRLVHYTYVNNNYLMAYDANNLNKTDVSLLAGIDYNISKNIYFCFRYSNSIIPVTKKNTPPGPGYIYLPVTFNQGNNMVFQFSIKFIFGNNGSNIQEPIVK